MSGNSWGKVYGDLWSHPKFLGLSDAAGFLWLRALSYSKAMETYGVIHAKLLPVFGKSPEVAAELVEAGLWDATDDGWAFHDWTDHQASREDAERLSRQRAEAGRKGGQRSRLRRKQGDPETSATSESKPLLSKTEATASKPKQNENENETKTENNTPAQVELIAPPQTPRKRGRAFVYPDAFEVWWKSYPRREDKRKAYAAWERVTRDVEPSVLTAAAERYRDDPNRVDAYTKLPTSWLNAGAWENGPLPPRGSASGRPQAGDTHAAMRRSHTAAQAYRALEDAGYYDTPQITPQLRRTA